MACLQSKAAHPGPPNSGGAVIARAVVRALWCCAMLVTCAGGAWAWTAPVPDVVLYCTPQMTRPMSQVAQLYTAQSRVEVHIFAAPPDGIRGLLKHRARDDVVVADQTTIRALAADQSIGPVIELGTDRYVLIGRAGAARSIQASAGQLVAARRTVLPDPTTAASFDGAAVLRAAFPAAAASAFVGVADTPTVIDAVRRNADLLGLVTQTEASSPGIEQLAILDVPPSTIGAGLVAEGQSANAASFLAFVASRAGHEALRSAGLETP